MGSAKCYHSDVKHALQKCRIFKVIATSGFLTALECIKFVFGRGSAPEHGGTPDLLAGLKGTLLLRRRGREGERRRRGQGEGMERRLEKGRGGAGPFMQIPGSAAVVSLHTIISVSHSQHTAYVATDTLEVQRLYTLYTAQI